MCKNHHSLNARNWIIIDITWMYLVNWVPRSWFPLDFINSLRLIDTICCLGTWSSLVQVMAWYLTAPSHDPNQCWPIVNLDHQNLILLTFCSNTQIFHSEMHLKISSAQCQPFHSGLHVLTFNPLHCTFSWIYNWYFWCSRGAGIWEFFMTLTCSSISSFLKNFYPVLNYFYPVLNHLCFVILLPAELCKRESFIQNLWHFIGVQICYKRFNQVMFYGPPVI